MSPKEVGAHEDSFYWVERRDDRYVRVELEHSSDGNADHLKAARVGGLQEREPFGVLG